MDNLNTHKLSSLYEAFEPAEARRIAERLEIHYTPKHGSWLNMAEIEIGVLARQCLDRRIANQDILPDSPPKIVGMAFVGLQQVWGVNRGVDRALRGVSERIGNG